MITGSELCSYLHSPVELLEDADWVATNAAQGSELLKIEEQMRATCSTRVRRDRLGSGRTNALVVASRANRT